MRALERVKPKEQERSKMINNDKRDGINNAFDYVLINLQVANNWHEFEFLMNGDIDNEWKSSTAEYERAYTNNAPLNDYNYYRTCAEMMQTIFHSLDLYHCFYHDDDMFVEFAMEIAPTPMYVYHRMTTYAL